MNKILIFGVIGLLVLSIGLLHLTLDIKNDENVYEYLSDGEYDRPLTFDEIEQLNKEFGEREKIRRGIS